MEELIGISLQWLILIALNFILIFILFLMNLSNKSKLKKLRTRYYKFMNGLSDQNIEQLLDDCIERVNKVSTRNKEIESHINSMERNLLHCLQKVGVVRFNAFDNVGSDLSFSIAALDSNDNGIVLSGLYSRDSSSSYAKPIIGGKSKYALSVEELKAIEIARKSYRDAPYMDALS